ncbi:MAG: hypothetical protein ACJAW3_001189 [Lentimonas sp.]|jgi:hypothetical protein
MKSRNNNAEGALPEVQALKSDFSNVKYVLSQVEKGYFPNEVIEFKEIQTLTKLQLREAVSHEGKQMRKGDVLQIMRYLDLSFAAVHNETQKKLSEGGIFVVPTSQSKKDIGAKAAEAVANNSNKIIVKSLTSYLTRYLDNETKDEFDKSKIIYTEDQKKYFNLMFEPMIKYSKNRLDSGNEEFLIKAEVFNLLRQNLKNLNGHLAEIKDILFINLSYEGKAKNINDLTKLVVKKVEDSLLDKLPDGTLSEEDKKLLGYISDLDDNHPSKKNPLVKIGSIINDPEKKEELESFKIVLGKKSILIEAGKKALDDNDSIPNENKTKAKLALKNMLTHVAWEEFKSDHGSLTTDRKTEIKQVAILEYFASTIDPTTQGRLLNNVKGLLGQAQKRESAESGVDNNTPIKLGALKMNVLKGPIFSALEGVLKQAMKGSDISQEAAQNDPKETILAVDNPLYVKKNPASALRKMGGSFTSFVERVGRKPSNTSFAVKVGEGRLNVVKGGSGPSLG